MLNKVDRGKTLSTFKNKFKLIMEQQDNLHNNETIKTTTKELPKRRIVTIKKIDSKKWHGKKGKEDFSRPKTITALVDGSTGRYRTGLNNEETKKYGEALGINLSDFFNINKPHEFWDSPAGKVRLENGTTTLNLDNPRDYVKYCILKESALVANSEEELEAGLYPNAVYVMFNEEGEEKIKLSKIERKREAMKELFSLDLGTKKQIVRILSEKSTRGKSDNFVDIEIDAIIENKPDEFLDLVRNTDKSKMFLKAMVLESLDRSILIKEEGKIKYMGDALGMDVEDCVTLLGKAENQVIKAKILEKLQSS